MKKNLFKVFAAFVCVFTCSILLAGCFGSTVKVAWVSLKTDGGYTYYTSYMYATSAGHIDYYENEEDAEGDTHYSNCAIQITFYPRIMGADTVDGVRTTTVDLSQNYCDMNVTIYKDKTNTYSADKDVYLNDHKLTPDNTYDGEYIVSYTYENVNFVCGNPGGIANGFVNYIEYK